MTDPVTPESIPDAASEVGAAVEKRNLLKTLVGVAFMYGSRGIGLLFTLALIARLGIADYGLYVLGLALASLVSAPLDNPWSVRSMRESDEDWARERVSRYLLGVTLIACGAAMTSVSYFVWFGLLVAGGEVAFNSIKAKASRAGNPNLVWRYDVVRSTTSVALSCIYLFTVPHPSLTVTSLLYCAPYAVILVLAAIAVWGHRPKMPGSPRQMGILVGEMAATVGYLQGDVLLLGWLTNSTVVGLYNIPLMLTSALAAVGQAYAVTYYEPLRNSKGDLSTGPPLRNTLTLASGVGLIVLVVGVVMLFTPVPTELALTMIVMAGFGFNRVIISVFQVVLFAQRRDRLRFGASLVMVPVKLTLLTVLVWAGLEAVGAALASLGADLLLLAVFIGALYGRWKK